MSNAICSSYGFLRTFLRNPAVASSRVGSHVSHRGPAIAAGQGPALQTPLPRAQQLSSQNFTTYHRAAILSIRGSPSPKLRQAQAEL